MRRRRKTLREKLQTHGQICALQNKWNNKKLETETAKLTEAAEKHDMRPIWGYQKNLRNANKSSHRHIPLKNRWGIHPKLPRNTSPMGRMDTD